MAAAMPGQRCHLDRNADRRCHSRCVVAAPPRGQRRGEGQIIPWLLPRMYNYLEDLNNESPVLCQPPPCPVRHWVSSKDTGVHSYRRGREAKTRPQQREMREMVLPPVTLLFRQKLPHFRDYCRESQYCVGGSPSQLSCYFLSATITTTAANDATFPSYQGHLFPTRLARVKEVLDFLDKYSHRNCHHRHIIVGGEYLWSKMGPKQVERERGKRKRGSGEALLSFVQQDQPPPIMFTTASHQRRAVLCHARSPKWQQQWHPRPQDERAIVATPWCVVAKQITTSMIVQRASPTWAYWC